MTISWSRPLLLRVVFVLACQMISFIDSTSVLQQCPEPFTLMAKLNYSWPGLANVSLLVCEDLRSANGSILFTPDIAVFANNEPWPVVLQKQVYANQAKDANQYLFNLTKQEVLAAETDIMGNMLLGIHGHPPRPNEPTLAEVSGAIPPLALIQGARVWTANRVSARDATFDENGASSISGTPSPEMVKRVLPGLKSTQFNFEGIVGGDLPILLFTFPTSSDTVLWEMSVVPQQRNTGKEQPVLFRFLQVNASVASGQGFPNTMYFDSFAYVPSKCSSDYLAGCDAPQAYFQAMLDTHFFWLDTWNREGRMQLRMPLRPNDTDGVLLHLQASHALVLDMITRTGEGMWPRYGTYPGYDQAGIGADGFQEIFTSTMMASLEWGLFDYAKGVLDNWLTYFLRDKGSVLYRGLEMSQQGRMLTNIAQYYRYTRDSSLLLQHFPKIEGVSWMLRQRRAAAITKFPASDSRHGMPTGNDEADLFWANNAGTELPFISIAAEMWRGMRDCGEALADIAVATGRVDVDRAADIMIKEAESLLVQLRKTMRMDAQGGPPRCFPYVAGMHECGMIASPSHRASEPWRTYSEALYSGAIEPNVTRELLEWHQTQQGSGVKGSRLKLGVLSGCGADVSCGDQLETFTIHGWGYGLLQADLIEPFLLQYFALSAHAYTRGTWIAPESAPIDRNQAAPSFATPAGLTAPILLKWLLVWEDPIGHTLWFGRALPRVWLSEGERLEILRTPTAYGRVSMQIQSRIDSMNSVQVNLTLPANWTKHSFVPAGGLSLRLRTPGRRKIAAVKIDGLSWRFYDVASEAITLSREQLMTGVERLQSIIVEYELSMYV